MGGPHSEPTCVGVFVVCNISFGRKEKHAAKLKFTLDALNADDPFAKQVELADDVLEAINWQSTRTDSEIVAYREALLSTLEQAGDLVLSRVIHVLVKFGLCLQEMSCGTMVLARHGLVMQIKKSWKLQKQ